MFARPPTRIPAPHRLCHPRLLEHRLRHVRHQALRRSHALAFATEEVDADELERRLADDALPLTMVKRSELRGAEGGLD